MPLHSRSRIRQQGASIVLMMCMLPMLLVPLVGLAIDGTRLYIVQSKLSAAVDGAVLGSGRLLGTNANTTEIAGEFLNANFPSGYWSTSGLQKNIQFTNNLGSQTITIYATVVLPLTFARIMGQPAVTLSATATATRRVTRVMMVLDRSGSMNNTDPVTHANVFTTMQASAEWFASQFTPGYDELGLIMFSGSGLVAYPTTHPWVNSPTGAGGPDTAFATNAQTMSGPIFTQLNNMAVGGGTGTPEALSQAYIELQKAHNRDLAANGVDNSLNTIVLFTDGVPDGIATYLNDPSNNSLKSPGSGSSHSQCTYNPATSNSASQMRGYIVAGGCPVGSSGCTAWSATSANGAFGLLRLAALDSSQSLSWWEGTNGVNDYTPGAPSSSLSGCTYISQSLNNSDLTDLKNIPTTDLYGNSTTGSAYTNSYLYDGSHYWYPNGTTYNPNAPTYPYNIAAAAWNATDAIGKTIRTQTGMQQVQIFTIGYSGNGGTDVGLLNRLANTPQSTSYDPTQPIGHFYLVNNTNQLVSAFNSVASSLLRLAQ
ncbi:MAG TPA: pilus assembly protein TadG-related protein [Bryobacteraceae bacterium]|nr:pilus assembly protein TadG-related protein [Bryobacteraceae bacterium]